MDVFFVALFMFAFGVFVGRKTVSLKSAGGVVGTSPVDRTDQQ